MTNKLSILYPVFNYLEREDGILIIIKFSAEMSPEAFKDDTGQIGLGLLLSHDDAAKLLKAEQKIEVPKKTKAEEIADQMRALAKGLAAEHVQPEAIVIDRNTRRTLVREGEKYVAKEQPIELPPLPVRRNDPNSVDGQYARTLQLIAKQDAKGLAELPYNDCLLRALKEGHFPNRGFRMHIATIAAARGSISGGDRGYQHIPATWSEFVQVYQEDEDRVSELPSIRGNGGGPRIPAGPPNPHLLTQALESDPVIQSMDLFSAPSPGIVYNQFRDPVAEDRLAPHIPVADKGRHVTLTVNPKEG